MTPSDRTPQDDLIDQRELAKAIRLGSLRRPQCFGSYFDDRGGSCALGAAYDGMYELPRQEKEQGEIVPRHLERLFHCLEDVVKRCPEECRKRLPLGSMIVHLNDDHGWSREQIAEWLSNGAPSARTTS
ncbi:MAG: hypothetical protein M3R55_05380 [Acidobacteriota bacterium]|nr:hypothetical protein [Acidobacteriota bacterium]